MAKALLVAQKTLEARDKRIADLSSQNEIMKPKADYFDRLVDRNTLTHFKETAKQLGIAPKSSSRSSLRTSLSIVISVAGCFPQRAKTMVSLK